MSDEEKTKQEEQEKYKNLQYRMYQNEFPKEGEIVMVSQNTK